MDREEDTHFKEPLMSYLQVPDGFYEAYPAMRDASRPSYHVTVTTSGQVFSTSKPTRIYVGRHRR